MNILQALFSDVIRAALQTFVNAVLAGVLNLSTDVIGAVSGTSPALQALRLRASRGSGAG